MILHEMRAKRQGEAVYREPGAGGGDEEEAGEAEGGERGEEQ